MPAHFHIQDADSKLKKKRALSVFLDDLIRQYLVGIQKISLNYIFCSDDYLLAINQQFLDHDTYTDIITFDLSNTENEIIGEIYISVDRIAENAKKFKTLYQQELHRVIFHGALHLCGFSDKTKSTKEEMTNNENLCLQQYFKEQN